MNHCRKPGCKLTPWRRGWCYTHWRVFRGFVFDAERKAFIKKSRVPPVRMTESEQSAIAQRVSVA